MPKKTRRNDSIANRRDGATDYMSGLLDYADVVKGLNRVIKQSKAMEQRIKRAKARADGDDSEGGE